MFTAIDHSLFLAFNAGPHTPDWAIQIGIVIAKYVIYLLPVMLLTMWLWGKGSDRSTALKALVVTVAALGCNALIASFWHTQRPFALELGHTYLSHAATASFPSNHLSIFMAIGLCCLLGSAPRLGVLTLSAGAAVAWARIFVGVHFPIDMLGAIIVTILAYALTAPFWTRCGALMTRQLVRGYRHVLAKPIAAGWLRP